MQTGTCMSGRYVYDTSALSCWEESQWNEMLLLEAFIFFLWSSVEKVLLLPYFIWNVA